MTGWEIDLFGQLKTGGSERKKSTKTQAGSSRLGISIRADNNEVHEL